jgi:DNA-binding response OmpR family regulator
LSVHNKVVIVVHDPSLRAAIRDVLEANGFTVVATADPDELLAALRAAADVPCVALIDLGRDSAWTLVADVRGEARFSSLPIIVVSSWIERDAVPENVTLLAKPFRRAALIAAVGAHCRRAS